MAIMADCNLSLYDAGYIGGLCESSNYTLDDVCFVPTDEDLCYSNNDLGQIIQFCRYFCQSCPHFLEGMDHDTRMAYLEDSMGPPGQSNGMFFSVILSVFCVFGSIANFLTIVVILRNKVLQTSSNYLLSLALSDLLMLLSTAPVEIKFQLSFWPWSFPQFFCRLQPYIKEACLYTTVLHIVAFTIERYIVICHPMRARTILSRSRASKVIVVIWISSFILAIPVFAVHAVHQFCQGIFESSVCLPRLEYEDHLAHFHGVISIILFFVPMTLIIVLYTLIARALSTKNLSLGRRTSTISSKMSKKRKNTVIDTVDRARQHAVKLLALVAVFFFILWFPFMWIRFRPLVSTGNLDESTYHTWYYPISMSLLYLSSCTNPVLYNVMSARFRKAYKKTVFCRSEKSSQIGRDGSLYAKPSSRTDTTNLTSTNFTAF